MGIDPPRTGELYDRETSVDYYDERYSQGYMQRWPLQKKQRITEVIRSLDLPAQGELLDFGCGNGIVTETLRQALPPAWKIYGLDISQVAVEKARRRFPGCTFYVAGDDALSGKKFDFLFTHHVLEHVHDLRLVIQEIAYFLKPSSSVLHNLPCGNPGSFEHNLCLLSANGINQELENRFFYEDEGHVRRLSSAQLAALMAEHGYSLDKEYYSSQRDGAIEYLTRHPRNARAVTTDTFAVDDAARRAIRRLRFRLVSIALARFPALVVEGVFTRWPRRTRRDYALLAGGIPLYVPSKMVDWYWRNAAQKEWDEKKTQRNGSEMYLFFTRKS